MRAAVFEVGQLADRCPAELFALVHPDGDGLELRGERNDRMVIAYTEYGLLASRCGTGQPWARVETAALARQADEERVRWVAVDLPVPEGHRYPAPELARQPPLEGVPRLPGGDGECWVASLPVKKSDRQLRPELLRQDSRRRLMLVYSSREAVEACCGPHQAAFPTRMEWLDELAAQCGATGVAFDEVIDPNSRHQAAIIR